MKFLTESDQLTHSVLLMICTWAVSVSFGFTNFAICGSDESSVEAHSVQKHIHLDSSVSSGFTNFAIYGSDGMYNNLSVLYTTISTIILLALMGVFQRV